MQRAPAAVTLRASTHHGWGAACTGRKTFAVWPAARLSLALAAHGSTGAAAGRDETSTGAAWIICTYQLWNLRCWPAQLDPGCGHVSGGKGDTVQVWLVRTACTRMNGICRISYTMVLVINSSIHLVCLGLYRACLAVYSLAIQPLPRPQPCLGAARMGWSGAHRATWCHAVPVALWQGRGEGCAMLHST